MVVGGDWDAFYRGFLSAQNGKGGQGGEDAPGG